MIISWFVAEKKLYFHGWQYVALVELLIEAAALIAAAVLSLRLI